MAHAKVRISPALIARAKQLRLQSVPARDISVRLGIPMSTLAIIFQRKGKLTTAKARQIWKLYYSQKRPSQRAIAKRFDVSRSCVFGIVAGKTWRSAINTPEMRAWAASMQA